MNNARRSLTGISGSGIASLGLLLGTLSGCFNPTPPANVLCAPDAWCPSGQTCDTSRWQCVPNGQIPDAGPWPWIDSGWPWPPDSAVPWWDAAPGEGIEAALAAPWGPVSIGISQVLVTYIMPPLGLESEGFFVQRDASGPAMFVSVSPNFTGVRLAVGDRVSFYVYEMAGLYDNSVAVSIGNLVVHRRNEEVGSMVQDVTGAGDLLFAAHDYVAELVSADLLVQGDFYEDSYGFYFAQVANDVIFDYQSLMVRVPTQLQQQIALERNCRFRVDWVPLWRYWGAETIFPIQSLSELSDVSCPEPVVRSAVADTNTTVQLEISRDLDPATVEPDGSQFLISDLVVTAATVNGRFVTLTTAPQVAGRAYDVQVAYGVRDVFGVAIPDWSLTYFYGVAPQARVQINEIKANIAPSCDLLELRVTQGGALNDVRITEQGATIHTLRNLMVATNDIIVIHFNGFSTPCNPGRSPSETLGVNQHPRVVFGANFDTAYDIYVAGIGLETTPHTVGARAVDGRLLDIVLLTGNPSLAPDASSVADAAEAASDGQWRTQAGSVPPGGFTGSTFTAHAAAGLDQGEVSVVSGWSALDGRSSVQRSSNADSNHSGDWTTAPHTFGLLNAGQSPL